jgi:hypothetical protein
VLPADPRYQTARAVLTTTPLDLPRAATAPETPERQDAVRLLKIKRAERVGIRENVASFFGIFATCAVSRSTIRMD